MAWTAFFFEAKYTSTRVTIGINALLALSYQFDNMDIPRASQVKGYEVWMFMCMTFIFVSLAELAAALRVITKSKRKYLNVSYGASFRHSYEKAQTSVKTVENSMLNSKKIDQCTMILLPLIFLIGNIFYWFYYVNYMFFE
uniref:Neurotransmitter-gated ion-channel transmembrane domain-containing protein n=1 Tax=Romanomermis culicivorax TaxID=13658 RepID=A0A915LA85_ROMCU